MWFSYSAYSQYKQCPKQYDYQRVSETPPPTKDSRHNAIIGSVVQEVFEDFYNEELWKEDDVEDTLRGRAQDHFTDFMENNYVDFNDVTSRFSSKSEPLKEIYEVIPKTLEGIRRENLIGPYTQSEKELKVPFQDEFLYGYLDFIIRKENGDVLLLDGKSSRHREEYVDEEQLLFYTLMFFKKYKRLPDKVGFFYFRFADDPDQAFDWIDFEKYQLMELKSDIKETMDEINNYNFEANPNYKWCQWCQWEEMCDERQEQKKKNRMKRKMNSSKKEIESDKNEDEIGFDALED